MSDGLDNNMVENISDEEVCIRLDESITSENIELLYKALLSVDSAQVKKVTLDADDVEEADFSALQLLVSFIQKMKGADVKVKWDNIPIPVFQSATDLNLCKPLGF